MSTKKSAREVDSERRIVGVGWGYMWHGACVGRVLWCGGGGGGGTGREV
jgi:hypothetical protein